jgi:hypothetical protein
MKRRSTLTVRTSEETGVSVVKQQKVLNRTHLRFRYGSSDNVSEPVPVQTIKDQCEIVDGPTSKLWLIHVQHLLEGTVQQAPTCSPSPLATPNLLADSPTPSIDAKSILEVLLKVPTESVSSDDCDRWTIVQFVKLLLDVRKHQTETSTCVSLLRAWMSMYHEEWARTLGVVAMYWSDTPKWLDWLVESVLMIVRAFCKGVQFDTECANQCIEMDTRLRKTADDRAEPVHSNGMMRLKVPARGNWLSFLTELSPEKGYFFLTRQNVVALRLPRIFEKVLRCWLYETGPGLPCFGDLHSGALCHALGLYVSSGSRWTPNRTRTPTMSNGTSTPSMLSNAPILRGLLPRCFREFHGARLQNGDRYRVAGALYRMNYDTESIQAYVANMVPGSNSYASSVHATVENLKRNPEKQWGAVCRSSFMPNNMENRSFLCPFFTEGLVDIEDAMVARNAALDKCKLDLQNRYGIKDQVYIQGPLDYHAIAKQHSTTK